MKGYRVSVRKRDVEGVSDMAGGNVIGFMVGRRPGDLVARKFPRDSELVDEQVEPYAPDINIERSGNDGRVPKEVAYGKFSGQYRTRLSQQGQQRSR